MVSLADDFSIRIAYPNVPHDSLPDFLRFRQAVLYTLVILQALLLNIDKLVECMTCKELEHGMHREPSYCDSVDEIARSLGRL